MKKIRRVLFAVLALCMLFALSACGKGNAKLKILDTAYANEDYAICFSKDNTDLFNKVNVALQELIDDGTVKAVIDEYISGVENDLEFQQDAEGKEELVMATNAAFPPYEYYDGETIVGIDADIAAAIADKLDMKLVIEDTEFDSIITGVQSGKYDMGMAGMTVTDERLESVDFTVTYATGVQVIIVREDSEITSVDDLYAEGVEYIVGVQTNTTGDLYITWDIDDNGLGLTVERYSKGADAVQALADGKIDCVIIDNEPAKAFVEANNG